MNSEFTLSQGAGQKLEFAVQRNGGTPEDIDYLSTGRNFRAVSLLRRGEARLVEVTKVVSGGSYISTPGWIVDGHGNIHFTLVSDGLTPKQWKERLGLSDVGVFCGAQGLDSVKATPTTGVAYKIVILPCRKIIMQDRATDRIQTIRARNGWSKPHWEVACLIRDRFSNSQLEDMGLRSVITMHEPITNPQTYPFLFESSRKSDCCFRQRHILPSNDWVDGDGFAFVVP